MNLPTLATETVLDALRTVQEPDLQRDIVTLHLVHDLAVKDGRVWMTLRLNTPASSRRAALEQAVRQALAALPGFVALELRFDSQVPSARAGAAGQGIPGVKNIIAVGSGKGGVGKTTVAVNLAIALRDMGATVGLLDADVYGPNVPRMMGVQQMPRVLGENRIEPLEGYGVRLMSMGFINPGDKPTIWRGPMLHSAVQQFLRQVEWGALDYLVIDLPPGTGDVVLSLAQSVPLTGGVVVTTPSEVSLEDARKALGMFVQLKVDVLGVVENMSTFLCPHCQQSVDIFSHGGGETIAAQFNVPFLGALPLQPEVRQGGDRGRPVAVEGAEAPRARPYFDLARQVAAQVGLRADSGPEDFLKIRA